MVLALMVRVSCANAFFAACVFTYVNIGLALKLGFKMLGFVLS